MWHMLPACKALNERRYGLQSALTGYCHLMRWESHHWIAAGAKRLRNDKPSLHSPRRLAKKALRAALR